MAKKASSKAMTVRQASDQSESLVVSFATADDLDELAGVEPHPHMTRDILADKIARRQVVVARQGDRMVGHLRFSMFWDLIPFIDLLIVAPSLRREKIGTRLAMFLEDAMRSRGHRRVLTSSLSSEEGQKFFRAVGYVDAGCLLLPTEPLEILFYKGI